MKQSGQWQWLLVGVDDSVMIFSYQSYNQPEDYGNRYLNTVADNNVCGPQGGVWLQ